MSITSQVPDNRPNSDGTHREAFLLAVLCVVTLDFAGGTGHRWTVGRFVTSHA
jgi:hypothetical protein